MTASGDRLQTETAAAAEQALAAALGAPVRLDAGEVLDSSPRSHAYRFRTVDGPAGAPPSVVVKRAAVEEHAALDLTATGPRAPAWRLFNDWAGLAFLTEVAGDVPVTPRFYAGDRSLGLIVIEDLGAGENLSQLLLGDDAGAAEQGLVELAALLGTMHARTIGKETAFNALRDALGPRDPESYEWLAPVLGAVVDAVSLTPARGVDGEVQALLAALSGQGPFRAYTHGDPCPDNDMRVGSGRRLLDFEFGAFRHALTDGVYGRMHFPTCWCVNRLPDQVPLRMEAAYRAALVQGCPEAADDQLFYRAVAEACAHAALLTCRLAPLQALLDEDEEWGIATLRQRVLLRFEIAARLAAEVGHLEAVGATLGAAAAKLRARWPPEADAMPYYPAFR